MGCGMPVLKALPEDSPNLEAQTLLKERQSSFLYYSPDPFIIPYPSENIYSKLWSELPGARRD